MQRRKAEINIVVGQRGCGKTTFLEKHVVARKENVIFLTSNMSTLQEYPFIKASEIGSKRGRFRVFATRSNVKETLSQIQKKFRDGVVIFDDIRSFCPGSKVPESLENILINSRMYMVEAYVVAHSMMKVPIDFFDYSSILFLFSSPAFRNRDIDEDKMLLIDQAQERLSEKIKTNPYAFEMIILDDQIRAEYEAKRKNNG